MKQKHYKSIVTGGAGFIGSHLCDFLLQKGHEVFCIDNLITGKKKNISHLGKNPNFHFLQFDITNSISSKYKSYFSDTDYVYHLASPASPPQYLKYSIETLMTNSLGTLRMLELTKESKSCFLLASTSEVYGDPQEHPQKETYFGHVNPVGLRSCYDESKRFAEALTMAYHRKYKLRVRIARIFNTYGPRMRADDGRVISNLITQSIKNNSLTIYDKGEQTRSFCFITDMIDGLLKLAEKENIDGEIFNLGNPDEQRIIDVAKIILRLTNSESSLVFTHDRLPDDPERRKPEISKAEEILGWKPKINLEQGLIQTIEYFRNS